MFALLLPSAVRSTQNCREPLIASSVQLLYDYSTEYGVSLDNGYESFKVGIQTYLAGKPRRFAGQMEKSDRGCEQQRHTNCRSPLR